MSANLDAFARQCMAKYPAAHVSWFLMSSFIYYYHCSSLISDDLFEGICKWLERNIDTIEHPHKHLITHDMFAIGSAFALSYKDYPLRVRSAAMALLFQLDELNKKETTA
jgi:ABC-type uncharacterized transport system YnjBCD permease subunit